MINKNQPCAVYQIGCAIFGVGNTCDEALADAVEWIEDAETPADVELECSDPQFYGDLKIENATPALVKYVQENGTCDFDEMDDGTVCLPEEVE